MYDLMYNITTLAYATETGNSNLTESAQPPDTAVFIISIVWSLIILTGVIGNGLVIYILFRYGERSVTNVYVTNLAFADLMFIIMVVPVTLIHVVIPTWILGSIICKFSTYMIYVTLHATCLTLSAMTIDRYHAIVNPIQSMNWRSTRASSFVCLGVWTASLCISLPFLLYYDVVPGNQSEVLDCIPQWPSMEEWNKGTTLGVVLTTFILPLTAIVICYGYILHHLWKGQKMKHSDGQDNENTVLPVKNSKQHRQMERIKRVTRMVAIVVLLFAVCWCPIHFVALWIQFDPNFPRTDAMHYFKLFGHTLSYANSCVNPFVYAFVNDGFKKAIMKRSPLLSKLCKCVLRPRQKKEETPMIDKAVEARPGLDGQSEYMTTQTTVTL
ncbi:KISS1R [Mytilus coruscus]|uniref:KISS1R n=1 Tax=Mytilus coruscus TaxID=42192 RepID=A0A6J8CLU4_MYTCO|nr:KISS1R [Mytilus coruscus]